jgi:hypothetical protein
MILSHYTVGFAYMLICIGLGGHGPWWPWALLGHDGMGTLGTWNSVVNTNHGNVVVMQ